MVELLMKMRGYDVKNIKSQKTRQAYGITCGILGIFWNVILCVIKFFAGLVSGSFAVMTDAFNNLADAGSSIITIVGLKLAGKKPDRDHPYGHGRVEYVTALIISFLIIIMGIELTKSSIEKIIKPVEPSGGLVVYIILISSIIVKLYMAFYNKKIANKIDSKVMQANAIDSIGDSISTTFVLISLLLSNVLPFNPDAYCGLAISILIIYNGYMSAKDTINPLLGNPPKKEFVKKIKDIVLAHKEISGMHDLMVHDYGPGRVFISLHAEIPASSDILEAHDTIDNIEREINEKLGCIAVIHMDPLDTKNEKLMELKNKVSIIVNNENKKISMHDFRAVKGPTHTNLVFDLLLPATGDICEKDLKKNIIDKIKEIDIKYNPVIEIDYDLTDNN